jgi:hypothetical protein
MSLFTADTEFLVYMDSRNPVPTQEICGRDSLRPVFENLSAYEATTHFNGQSAVTWEQDAATGVSYCLAHHVKVDGQTRSNSISGSIREDGWPLVLPATKVDGRLGRQPPAGPRLTHCSAIRARFSAPKAKRPDSRSIMHQGGRRNDPKPNGKDRGQWCGILMTSSFSRLSSNSAVSRPEPVRLGFPSRASVAAWRCWKSGSAYGSSIARPEASI